MAVADAKWFSKLEDNNIFFHHIGKLGIEEGSYKVIKSIDVKILEEQINHVKEEVMHLINSCTERSCSLGEEKGGQFTGELNRLNVELTAVYSLLGKGKAKRSVDFIGTGLKYMFGTMDHDDEIQIRDVLQNVGDRQDRLRDSMQDSIKLMSNLSSQWEMLKQNQKVQFDNFMALKKVIAQHYEVDEHFHHEIDLRTVELHFENLLLSIQVQVDKLRNAILFLKAGVVDPYFVSSNELFEALNYERLGYNLTIGDIHTLMGDSKPVAVCNDRDKRIYIIFQFPVANKVSFDLYENLVIPKISKEGVIVLSDIPKYFANTVDSYFSMNSLTDCLVIAKMYICKNTVVFKAGSQGDCVSDLFYRSTDSNCKYSVLSQDFTVHNTFDSGLILFSTSGVVVRLICGKFLEKKNFTGAYLINAPRNCSLESKLFVLKAESRESEVLLVDKVPKILCCSSYFKSNHSTVPFDKAIVLKSLHDIQKLNADDLGKALQGWNKFKNFDMKDHVGTWHFNLTVFAICLIIISLVWYKFRPRYGRNRSMTNNNIVVRFDALTQKEVSEDKDAGYNVF